MQRSITDTGNAYSPPQILLCFTDSRKLSTYQGHLHSPLKMQPATGWNKSPVQQCRATPCNVPCQTGQGTAQRRRRGFSSKPSAAKSEADQSLGAGIIKHLGLVCFTANQRDHTGFSAFFLPHKGYATVSYTVLPSCLVLVAASQDSLRSRRQLPKSGPAVVSYKKIYNKGGSFCPFIVHFSIVILYKWRELGSLDSALQLSEYTSSKIRSLRVYRQAIRDTTHTDVLPHQLWILQPAG